MRKLMAFLQAACSALTCAAMLLAALALPAQEAGERAVAVVPVKPTTIPDAKRNWGVFVGINNFQAEGVAPLRFCVRDARALRDALTGPDKLIPNEQSYLLTSDQTGKDAPTRINILKTIQYVCTHASEDSLILISISTHGFTDTKGDGGAYVLPADGDPELLAQTAVSVKVINDFLTKARATKRLLFVDACREDTARGEKGAVSAMMTDRFQKELQGAKGQVTLASCDESQVSYEDSERGHGVFTYYLLQGLTGQAPPNHKGFITVDTLFSYAADKTREWCRDNRKSLQEPWKYAAVAGDIPLAIPTGFTYVPPPVVTPLPTAPPAPPAPVAVRPTPAQTPRPAVTAPASRIRLDPSKNFEVDLGNGQKIEMIWLPGGTFTMGTAAEDVGELTRRYKGRSYTIEQPARQVTINPFWIGKYEVTNAQYRAFNSRHSSGVYSRTLKLDLNTDNQPVVNVSWQDAKKFTDWLSSRTQKKYDLPTEAQWEFAAQGGTNTPRYWGEDDAALAEYENSLDLTAATINPRWVNAIKVTDNFKVTAPVGSFKPNPFGLFDMLGNVREFCRDSYDEGFYQRAPAENPFNSVDVGRSKDKVTRGGSWLDYGNEFRAAYRGKGSYARGTDNVGFRIVMEE